MSSASRSAPPIWNAPRLVLLVVGVFALVGLTQCRMAPDALTGIDKGRKERKENRDNGNCFSKCAKEAEKKLDKEEDRHDDNLEDCDRDAACITAENERHQAALAQIEAEKVACVSNCHHQGGGRGGHNDD